MIGQTISHYRILEKLGEGGMGVVYKAQDLTLDRLVALKFLPPHLSPDETETKRFIHEAKAASALDHPNICTFYEIAETADKKLFIAMAYYEGETVREKIRERPLPLQEAVSIAIAAAEGMAKAHEKGITHRDIKSDNIMLTRDGGVKIMDFGLARMAGGTKITKTGTTIGTVPYMSPEQARGEMVDHRADIWSFGVVLYEMITGQLPFKSEHEEAVVYSILNVEPEPITGLRTGVPMELERIVSKAMQKNASERYQHVDEMIVDLKSLSKRVEAASGERTPERRLLPRKRRLLYAGIGIFAVFAGVASYIFLPSKSLSVTGKSIAVLPFKNMSDGKEEEYFSDGITEDIITHLSNIGELKVISRTSIMQYKNSNKNLRDIAKELDVATVLEGSVRRAGNQVRIVAQLIDASSDEHLWAHTYDKEMIQIFAIQSDVAEQIAGALKATLSPALKERFESKPTESLTAYDYYLKGRDYYYRFHKQDNETAIGLFKKAIELDTNYALAYAGLGDAYGQRVQKFDYPLGWLDSSIEISTKALSKDPNCAEAYKALGLAYDTKGWTRKALEMYRKSLELNPNYFPALLNAGGGLCFLGDFVEGMKWMRKGLSMNPTSAISYYVIGHKYYLLTDDVNAEKCFRRALELQPDFVDVFNWIGQRYLLTGEFRKALEVNDKKFSLDHDTAAFLGRAGFLHLCFGSVTTAKEYLEQRAVRAGWTIELAYLNLKSAQRDSARKFLEGEIAQEMKDVDLGNEFPYDSYEIARRNAVLGRKSEALKWLRKVIEGGWVDYRYALVDYTMRDLREDDEFKRMIAEVKAKVDRMKQQVQEMEKE